MTNLLTDCLRRSVDPDILQVFSMLTRSLSCLLLAQLMFYLSLESDMPLLCDDLATLYIFLGCWGVLVKRLRRMFISIYNSSVIKIVLMFIFYWYNGENKYLPTSVGPSPPLHHPSPRRRDHDSHLLRWLRIRTRRRLHWGTNPRPITITSTHSSFERGKKCRQFCGVNRWRSLQAVHKEG